jgi:MSHA type pilus biogenesis protein MshL
MATNRIKFKFICLLSLLLYPCLLSCAYKDNLFEIKREVQIPKEAATVKSAEKMEAPIKTPDLIPVQEDLSPIKTRIVDLAARNTPLRDVLAIVADATSLNLVMDKDVNPEIPITLSLKNVTAEDALNKLFTSADYFYTVKGNMLFVKATETRTFELGHPAVIQTYTTDIGGDMLGAAMSTTGGGSHLKGSISQKTESDKAAYNFWDIIEKSIEKILAPQTGDTSSAMRQSFTVNRMTGTIIITSTRKNLEKLEEYINTVKKIINRQVIVEAKVIEVTLSDSLKFGIDWSNAIQFSDRQTGRIGTSNFANVVSASSATFFASTTGADFNALLNAIQSQGETRILSNPRVNIMNGQTALLSVGKNVSFISKVETTQTTIAGSAPTITFSISTGNVLSGIMIGIVPYINELGEISLTITPIVSDLVDLKDENFGTPDSSGNYPYRIQLPTIDLRQMSTTVKAKNSQMIVIGGLISKKEQVSDDHIPGFGDIPLLGYLFKKKDKSFTKSELVVLLQPVIVSR